MTTSSPGTRRNPTPRPPAPSGTARWSVDPALPGAKLFERVLARGVTSSGAHVVRLTYLDAPVVAEDSAHAAWQARGVTPLFAMRCPVLAVPGSGPVMTAIGANAFANLISCAGGTP